MRPTIIQSLLGSDNAQRKQAEDEITAARENNPQDLMAYLAEGIKKPQLDQAQLSCVLMKKYFLDDKRDVGAEALENMKTTVTMTLDFSQPFQLLKRKGEIVAKIFSKQEKTEEFMNYLSEWSKNESPNARMFAMYMFEVLAEHHMSENQLKKYKDTLMKLFVDSFKDPEVSVRVSALKATTAFLESFDDTEIVLGFKEIVPLLLDTIVEALKTDEDQGRAALQSMVELSTTHAAIWESQVSRAIETFAQIMGAQQFEDGTRAVALEIVIAFTQEDGIPAAVRKAKETKSILFPTFFRMMAEVDDDVEGWLEMTDDEEIGKSDPFSIGKDGLNNIATFLGGLVTLEGCMGIINEGCESQNWKQKVSALNGLGIIAESCKDALLKKIDSVMKKACKGLIDENPRVRYSALSCVALLCTELAPTAQKKYHQELMPVFFNFIENEQHSKMKTHAVSATINFVQGLAGEDEKEKDETKKNTVIIGKYVDNLLNGMAALIEQSVSANQESLLMECLNLVSAIARIVEDKFADYYGKFMPALKQLLTQCPQETAQQKNIVVGIINCMGTLIEAVINEKEKFGADVMEIATALGKMLDTNADEDDPIPGQAKETLIAISSFLKEDFVQFTGPLLTLLIKDANTEVDVQLLDSEQAVTGNNTAIDVKVKGLGDKKVSLNTHAMTTKVAACELLVDLPTNMGEAFAPFIETLCPVMVNLLNINMDLKKIKKASLKSITAMVGCLPYPANCDFFHKFLEVLMPKIQKALETGDLKELKPLVKAIFCSMRNIYESNKEIDNKNMIPENLVVPLCDLLNKVLQVVSAFKKAHARTLVSKKRSKQIDEEDMWAMVEKLHKATKVSSYVMEFSGQMVQNYKGQYANQLKQYFTPYFAQGLEDYMQTGEEELTDSLIFFVDFVEHAARDDIPMITDLIVKNLEIFDNYKNTMTKEISTDVRQSIMYGHSLFLELAPQAVYAPHLKKLVGQINTMLSAKNAFSDEVIVATEQAISTLGRAIVHQKDDKVLTDAIAIKFFEHLPLKAEEEEAQKCHKIVLSQVMAERQGSSNLVNKVTLDAAMQAIQRMKDQFETVKAEEEIEILDEETIEMIKQL